MEIIDVITYNGEAELFEMRYNILKDYVDEFIVIEFDKTFSGRPKKESFPYKSWPKVKYFFNTEEIYSKYREMAEQSPNTIGAEHWKMEFMQKESIKDCLTHLSDNSLVFIGDCDEIWNPEHLIYFKYVQEPEKLKLQVYTYYLNNYSTEEFWGTLISRLKWVKDECLNHLRSDSKRTEGKFGWHFTSLKDALKQKLTDSYTEETYANKWIMDNLDENLAQNKDFLGRDFKYYTTEISWPKYLENNRHKYKHLLK